MCHSERGVLQIFLMTDGEVMNTREVIQEVARNAHTARYVVGKVLTTLTVLRDTLTHFSKNSQIVFFYNCTK